VHPGFFESSQYGGPSLKDKSGLTGSLVTPVSGAVVLENQQQYEAAGLQPVGSMTVPSIPEPGTMALIALGLAMLGFHWRRRAGRC